MTLCMGGNVHVVCTHTQHKSLARGNLDRFGGTLIKSMGVRYAYTDACAYQILYESVFQFTLKFGSLLRYMYMCR